MCRLPILMVVAFIGFILLVANLPTADCSGNGKEKMDDTNKSEPENAPAESDDDDIALRKIFVGQLPYSTSDETLREYFKQFGEVEDAYIIRNRRTYESNGYGFVMMKNKEGADKALGKLEPKIDGRFVKINLASKPKYNKDLSDHLNSRNQLRQSESDDISLREIFVGGLCYETTHKALRRYFQQYGEVEKAFVKKDENTGKNQGYGFVVMKDKEGADRALENPTPFIDGRKVDVNLASKPENNKHLSARLNSMNQLRQSQIPNPNIDGQRANANLTYLSANSPSYSPLASGSTSMNPTPQFQWRRKENPNPNTVGQTSNKPSAYLVANPHSNAPLADHSNSAYQNSATQNSHYMIFETEKGKFIQPGILHPPATQNSHYMIFDTPNGTLAHPLPNLTARQFQRSLTRHLSMLNSRAATGGQQPTTNVRTEQPSQTGSRLPAYSQTTAGSTGQNHPTESETNTKIGKPPHRPKSAPAVLRATGTTNNNLPSTINNENWFERYSVKRNRSERNNQQNIVFDTVKNKKDSTVKDKKPIEKESAGMEKNTAISGAPKHENDESNSGAELLASEKFSGAISVPESSSKVEDKKMSWADMVEEEEKENQQTKEEKEQQTNNAVLMLTREHHPTIVAKKHEAAGGKAESEAEKSNVDTVDHHKNQKLQTMVLDDNKNYEEQKHKNDIREKIPTAKDEKHIGGHSPHQKLETKVFDDNKKDSNMIEDKFPNVKEEMSVGDHSPKDHGDKFTKDNANNPIKNDEVLDVQPKKSYLNIAQTPQIVSKKDELVHSMRASTSKIGSENANKKKNLPDKVKEIERKGHESDEKREIFVGQLAYSATEEILQKYFQQFGDVEKVIVVVDPKTKKNRGFGFVWMKEEKDVKKACENPNPTINGRPVYLEAYEGSKRKNKRFSTPSNSTNQLPQQLQEGQKKKPNPITDKQQTKINSAYNKHLADQFSGKDGKHFDDGHLPAEHDYNVVKDDVNNPIKNDDIPAVSQKKSYLNVVKTSSPASKKNDVKHPTSTSNVGGEEDVIKKNDLTNKVKEFDENGQERQTYASIVMSKKVHQPPKEIQKTHGEAEGKGEDEIEKTNFVAIDEHHQTEQIPLIVQNHDMEEMLHSSDGAENVVVEEAVSEAKKVESGGKSKKGSKKKKNGKGFAKNVDVRKNMAESWELTDLGDLPQILEKDDQKKSAKNKSAEAVSSSYNMGRVAKERIEERAKYLATSLYQFQFQFARFLHRENALPNTNDQYARLLGDVFYHLRMDREQTIVKIANLIEEGLQERNLKYIRLIGAGSLRQQDKPFIYDKEMRDVDLAALTELENDHFAKIYSQQRQIFAIYQLALCFLIAEGFQVTPAHVTVEDIHFDESDKKFLEGEYGYTTILSDDGTKENLVKIPSHVAEMGPDDVTLIIIINCPIKMTTDLIKSYGKHSKQLILMESSMSDLYDKKHTNNKEKQLILMESSMSDLYVKKHTNNKDRKNFQENRRQFQIRKPLPTTFFTEHVFQQKDVKDVQICYAKVNVKSAKENVPSQKGVSESSKLSNESNIDDSITPKRSQITQESGKSRAKGEEIKAVSTISEMIANISTPNEDDVKIVGKQEKNRKKKEKRVEAKARKAELMTSKKDDKTISGEGSSKTLKAETSEMKPIIESPNKVKDTSIIEKKNQQIKEKMGKVLTEALLASKSDGPATSMIESSYKALKAGLMTSKKDSTSSSVQESSSDQPKDESLIIGAKGIEKMFAKKENKNE